MLNCPHCSGPLAATSWNSPGLVVCPACGGKVWALAFPALLKAPTPGEAGEKVREAGEASCFFHPGKRAVAPCGRCGRFLCALCDLEFNDEHLCPSCLEAGRTKGKIQTLGNRHVRYDILALWLAIVPLVFCFYTTIIGAPVAIYLVIRHWRSPLGATQRGKNALVWAGVLAVIELAAWAVILSLLAWSYFQKK